MIDRELFVSPHNPECQAHCQEAEAAELEQQAEYFENFVNSECSGSVEIAKSKLNLPETVGYWDVFQKYISSAVIRYSCGMALQRTGG